MASAHVTMEHRCSLPPWRVLSGFGAVSSGSLLLGSWNHNTQLPSEARTLQPYFNPSFPVKDSLKENITFLELIPLLVWGKFLRRSRVIIASDNMSTVSFINRGHTRNPLALK